MIDLGNPVWFYDESKGSDDIMRMVKLLWQNDKYILCQVIIHEYNDEKHFEFTKWDTHEVDEPILFDRTEFGVRNTDYDRWLATNDISSWRPFGWTGS